VSVPYHRLPRVDANWRWWRPLVAIAVFLGFYVASQVVIGLTYIVVVGVRGGQQGLQDFLDSLQSGALDPTDPLTLSISLVSLVVLLPAIMLSVRLARLGPYGLLSSVRTRIRWRWMAWCLLPVLVLAVITFSLQSQGYFAFDGGLHFDTAQLGQSTVTLQTLTTTIVMVVVLVPFQGAAEEYVFRGFLLQTIGSWIPLRRVGLGVAIAVSTVVFALLHVPNGYNVWGILDVGSFGLVAAVIVVRTGGLEATILQHALNNVMIFVLQAPGWSKVDITGEDAQGNWQGFVVTLATSLLYWGMIELLARWRHLDRRFPGAEAPRFRGAVPAWAGGRQQLRSGGTGWALAPAHAEGTAGSDLLPAGSAEPQALPVERTGDVGRRP